jgi:tetratricopeptide (TPR) repeat protein
VVALALLAAFAVSRVDGGNKLKPTDLGYQALRKSDWETALARFDEAIRAEPKNAVARQGLGLTYGMMGKLDLGIAELTKAIQLDPTEARAYRSRGSLYLLKSDYDHAIADCDEAIRRGLRDSTTYNNRGYAYLCKGGLEKAVSDLTEAIRLDPQCGTKVYAHRGLAWGRLRLYDRAITDLSKAIQVDHRNFGAFLLRAAAYYRLGESDKALGDLSAAIQLDPKSVEARRQRGSIYIIRGDIDLALEDFCTAIRLNPKDPEAYLGRGNCFSQQQQYDRAIADFDAAIRLKPNSPCYYEGRGAMWICRGNYERGIADIETAIRLNPADIAATYEAWPNVLVSAADFRHGQQQVRQMLQDRPAMGRYGENARVLYEWAARKFSGEDAGQEIVWDSSDPHSSTAENQSSWDGMRGIVRVAERYPDGSGANKERSFEELWCDVVFELQNITNAKDFLRITKEVADGKLSKEEFVEKINERESLAAEKTRAFYIRVFLPWAAKERVSTRPGLWYVAERTDVEESFLRFRIPKTPVWRHYEQIYDQIRGRFHNDAISEPQH